MQQLQDTTLVKEQNVQNRNTVKDSSSTGKTYSKHLVFKKQAKPIDYTAIDTLSYFFHNLEINEVRSDSVLYKCLEDAPEFYVDSVIKAQKKELHTHYDDYKYYIKNVEKEHRTVFSSSTDWIFGVIFFIGVMLLIIKNIKEKFFSHFFSLMLKYREFTKNIETANYNDINANNLLSVIFSISTGLYAFLLLTYFKLNLPKTFIFYLSIVLLLLLLFILKRLYVFLSGYFLAKKELTFKYNRNIQLFNNLTGLILIPFVSAIPFVYENYVKYLIFISLLFITIIYLIRIFRSLKIFIEHNVSGFYMILYLCSLEIMPNLLLYKSLLLLRGSLW